MGCLVLVLVEVFGEFCVSEADTKSYEKSFSLPPGQVRGGCPELPSELGPAFW